MSILYVVATPIGNLKDFSQRAIETLKRVDLILSEDTRVTKKLLNYYQIKTLVLSYHQHSKFKKINHILDLLKKGKNLALVSDAGTPGISDPGGKLVKLIIEEISEDNIAKKSPHMRRFLGNVAITPIPGPSALIAAASISGLAMDKFVFMGFPPQKKKRKKFFEEIINSKYPVIFYESPYRIIKTLNELKFALIRGQISENLRQVVVFRELTKKFETIHRGQINQVIKEIEKDKVKGEFVVIVAPIKHGLTKNKAK